MDGVSPLGGPPLLLAENTATRIPNDSSVPQGRVTPFLVMAGEGSQEVIGWKEFTVSNNILVPLCGQFGVGMIRERLRRSVLVAWCGHCCRVLPR